MNNKLNNENAIDIAKEFNLARTTINKYLDSANKLGWCEYDGRAEKSKNCKKIADTNNRPIEIFKDGLSLGTFKSASELERKSIDIFGDVLYTGGISLACSKKRNHYKGYMFKYMKDNISCFC